MDLLGGTDGPIDLSPPQITKTINANTITNNTSGTTNNQDLLDLLGGLDLTSPVMSPGDNITTTTTTTTNGNIYAAMGTGSFVITPNAGLLDDISMQHNIGAIITHPIKLTALDKNGINVILVPQRTSGCLQVMMTATNNSLTTVEQFLFQAAVPKSFTLQMLSPSGSLLPPGGTITQEMRLTNSAKVIQI